MLSAFADYAHIICTPFVCCLPVEKLLGRVPCSAQITVDTVTILSISCSQMFSFILSATPPKRKRSQKVVRKERILWAMVKSCATCETVRNVRINFVRTTALGAHGSPSCRYSRHASWIPRFTQYLGVAEHVCVDYTPATRPCFAGESIVARDWTDP